MRHLGPTHLLRFALAGLAIGSGAVTSVVGGQAPAPTVDDGPATGATDPTKKENVPPVDPAARQVIDRAIEAMGGLDGRQGIRWSRSRRLEMGDAATIDLTTMKGTGTVRYRPVRGRPDLMEIGCDGTTGYASIRRTDW